MLTNSLPRNAASRPTVNGYARRSPQAGALLPINGSSLGRRRESNVREARSSTNAVTSTLEIAPGDAVKRRTVAWPGMTAEIVQATRREKIECRFRGPVHMLAVCEQGARSDGETFIEGLPRSALRDLKKKLTFVPAGHEYREWQEPRILSRVVYFYFDPGKISVLSPTDVADLAPRLYFEDAALWDTALKLTTLIESASVDNQRYLEAVGLVLAHELARLDSGLPPVQAPIRGGLAAWQQRVIATHIEEHLADQIPLATLAQLARLSPCYFCRAFKQSFGMPPHRYHTSRRIERAKELLAKPAHSVTEVGSAVGFSDTSSFTTAFRKWTGFTPTAYRRSFE
jgi:AraC family transcriptional regulator